MSTLTYVITPILMDVIRTCEKHEIECPFDNGRLLNQSVVWIYDWKQLAGRKINKEDQVIWGDRANMFSNEMYNKIYEEIELRRRF